MEPNNKELTQPMAIVVAGFLIAGAVLIGFSWQKPATSARQDANSGITVPAPLGNTLPSTQPSTNPSITLTPVTAKDRIEGDAKAKVILIEYADFQCPFCGKFFSEVGPTITTNYINTGKIQFVYRDYAFLGPESIKAAEAARCAGDQGKFWTYHDYLFSHQNGENQGNFSNPNLKSFAKTLGLDENKFNTCLDSDKYAQAVADSTDAGNKAGVQGTPKGFILLNGKIVSTIDGAEPLSMVTAKLDNALK